LEVAGGEELGLTEAGCAVGTTIIVRDLFFHTPARMKFLKKDVSEGNAVAVVLERIALSAPQIAFEFLRDGKCVWQTPGDGVIGSAVRLVLGKPFYAQSVGVKGQWQGVAAEGFVGAPEGAKPNRNGQYFFLNGRYIRCATASAALSEAFKTQIPAGKFPTCVLYLTIDPQMVDVNIHPAKTEVRFADDRLVFTAVRMVAAGALGGVPRPPERNEPYIAETRRQDASLAEHAHQASVSRHMETDGAFYSTASVLPTPVRIEPLSEKPSEPSTDDRTFSPPAQDVSPAQTEDPAPSRAAVAPQQQMGTEAVRVIGEAFRTYIFCERAGEVLLIDKHAAHERILYERLKSGEDAAQSQILLSPLPVRLNSAEAAALIEHADLLEKTGFAVEPFGNGTVLLREIPGVLSGQDLSDLLSEIAGYLLEHKTEIAARAQDRILFVTACHAAVRAGDFMGAEEMQRFVESVLADPAVRSCPHGRPVMAVLGKRELEKRFGRIV
jgi:DNA mismatch repair protein MutL